MPDGQLNNREYAGRPSMCRNCGALVGADEATCSLCGAPKISQGAVPERPQHPARAYDHETVRFARAVLTRPYIFTIIFLAANVFVFMLMWSSGGLDSASLWEPPQWVLYAYGAKLNYLIKGKQEWWRFVTPVFIHIGALHLLVNMYGLWMIGPYVERLYGSAKFVVLWVATGVAGVVASYLCVRPELAVGPLGRFLFRPADVPAAGASGALFGLIGVLFVFGIKFRRELPEGFKRAFGTGLLPIIIMNLAIGYMGRGFIDNAAHLGGLFSGALFALAIRYKRPDESAGVAVFWHVLQVLALALVAVSFVMVTRHFSEYAAAPAREAAQTASGSAAAEAYLNALGAGELAFVSAFNEGKTDQIPGALEQVERAPRLGGTADAIQDEMKSLLAKVKEFAEARPKTGKPTKERQKETQSLLNDFVAWQRKRLEWIKTEGPEHGIELMNSGQPDSGPDSPAAK